MPPITWAYLSVFDDIQEADNVGSAGQVLKNLDLTLDLLLTHRFQHLNDALLVRSDAHSLKHFGILASADFAYNFVVVLRSNIRRDKYQTDEPQLDVTLR